MFSSSDHPHFTSPAQEQFTFAHPPMIGWWKAEHHLSLPSATFLHHFQLMLGMNTVALGAKHWEVGSASWWQDGSGVSPRQWPSVMRELGDPVAGLLSFLISRDKNTRSVFIRPGFCFLDVFGLFESTYDIVACLDAEESCRSYMRTKADRDNPGLISCDEINALGSWISRGGLDRVRNPGHLCALSESEPPRSRP